MRTPIIAFAVLLLVVVLTTGFWDNIESNVLPDTTWGLYSRPFFENILVEAHGAIIDLFIVGIVLFWFEQRRARGASVATHEEALLDLRSYRGADAAFRTLGTIKRLHQLGTPPKKLSQVSLSELKIDNLKLTNCDLHAADFRDSRLSNFILEDCECDAAIFVDAILSHSTLSRCRLRRAKFQAARLPGLAFTTCDIEASDFTGATLRSADFRGVNCKGVTFKNADIHGANFIGATNLTAAMLLEARSIKYVKTDDSELRKLVAASSSK